MPSLREQSSADGHISGIWNLFRPAAKNKLSYFSLCNHWLEMRSKPKASQVTPLKISVLLCQATAVTMILLNVTNGSFDELGVQQK